MIDSIVIGVSDRERAGSFYFDLLGASESDVELIEVSGEPRDGHPERGLKHVAWNVESVDREAERLRAAGVRFAVEPKNGRGVERLAFLLDPDGTWLELVQGYRQYHRVISPELAAAERARDRTPPALDHVGIGVADLEQTLAFYETFGICPIGEIHFGGSAGAMATHLDAGRISLEIFSGGAPDSPPPRTEPLRGPGLRSMRLSQSHETPPSVEDPDGVRLHVSPGA